MSMSNIYIYFVGVAGSGKSSMTHAFKQWMDLKGLDTVLVNLDPGAEDLPYTADVDIREWITIPQVMKDHGLGPNGAQIAAADMLALKVVELAEILDKYETNYFLVDTPGQLELFSFRKSSHLLVNNLGGGKALIAFVIDPLVARTPEGLISQIMLRSTVQFRFLVPVIGILSKTDLLEADELKRIVEWSTNAMALNSALTDGHVSTSTQINLEFLTAMETVGALNELVALSSVDRVGFEDLYDKVQQVFHGGDDLTSD